MLKQNTYRFGTVSRILAVLLGLVFVIAFCAVLYAREALAAPSTYLNFQARLRSSTGSLVPDGNYNIEFKIYNQPSGGSALWTETRTGGNVVRVANGYFSVSLGSVTAFPDDIEWGEEHWITMNIGGTGSPSWDGEMNPRLQLTAVPFAFMAERSGVSMATQGVVTDNSDPDGLEGSIYYNTATHKFRCYEGGSWKDCVNEANGTVTSISVSGGTTGLTTSGGPITTSGTITLGGTLAVTNGGTGATNASGARTNLGLGGLAVLSNVNNSHWSGAQLTVANGGTGATTQQGAINNLSGLTTQGDLLYHNGTNTTRLARGTSGQCLTSDGSTIVWANCGLASEADTLATVTARGATTSTASSFTGGATVRGLTVDTATATQDRIRMIAAALGTTRFDGTITNADLTATRTWTLPNASGTFAVSASGNIALSNTGNITFTGALPVANGGTGATDAAGARTNLGLGSLATLSTINNSNWSGTDLSVANGGTGASNATDARTNLGATTVGANFFTLTNPGAITFARINADNTISTLNAADFRAAIGAGTGNGTVTSIATNNGITGGTITGTGTLGLTGQALNVHNMATNGFFYRNGATIGARSLAVGTGLTVTNANGASGNPTISFATTGTGAAFIQGGNSFGAAAVLGTNDAYSLSFETGGTTRWTIDNGASTLTGSGASTIAGGTSLSLQAANGGVNITASGSNNITLGTSNTTGTLLVLDTKTNAGDPAGVNGGMYYNSNAGKFRCYEDGSWKDCIATAGGDILDGGNTKGADITIGTNDAYGLNLKTDGTTRLAIGSSGNIGIGIAPDANTARLHVAGTAPDVSFGRVNYFDSALNSSSNTQTGSWFNTTVNPSAALGQVMRGMVSDVSTNSNNVAGTTMRSLEANTNFWGTGTLGASTAISARVQNSSTGTTATAHGILVESAVNGSGTISNNYGMYIQNQTSGTNNYGLYIEGASTRALHVDSGTSYFGGNVGIGTISPSVRLDIEGAAGSNAGLRVNAVTGYYGMQYFAENGVNKWHYEAAPTAHGGHFSIVESGVAERLRISPGGAVSLAGHSAPWGVAPTTGLRINMGTSSSATWLIGGYSGANFRGGIQLRDNGTAMRLYADGNFLEFGNNNLTVGGALSVGGNITSSGGGLIINGVTRIHNSGAIVGTTGTFSGNVSVNGTLNLGPSGQTFTAIRRTTITWDPPSTSNNNESVHQTTCLPAGSVIIGVVAPGNGPSGGARHYRWGSDWQGTVRFDADSTQPCPVLSFLNNSGSAQNPASGVWSIWYIAP